jgi:integrase
MGASEAKTMTIQSPDVEKREPKLLDRIREAARVRHLSLRTEKAYVNWAKRYILFHGKKHPQEMGETEINAFLTHLAVEGKVSASTQTQALCSLLFLYRTVLAREVGELEGLVRARRKRKLPVVLTIEEVKRILSHLSGTERLFLSLLYGTGMRLAEALRLRVKDVDFAYSQITVRDGKGAKDRVTMLPASLEQELKDHLKKVKRLHEESISLTPWRGNIPELLATGDGNTSFRPRASPRTPGVANAGAITFTNGESREPFTTPAVRPASSSMRPATPCATPSRPTFCRAATTSGRSRRSWATAA